MTRHSTSTKTVPGGVRIFQRIFTRLGCAGRPPQFVVEFHPYAGLNHTIRLREQTAYVRLSNLLRDAPLAVAEAAAAILLSRIYRKRVPKLLEATYRNFALARTTRRRILAARRKRSRRLAATPDGRFHDLSALFGQLNAYYFGSRLQCPRLGWSLRAWSSQLGCFDPALHQIVINRALDHKEVPAYVVRYVLYHEMLHVKHPARVARCRLESHSARFRKEEMRFAEYDKAMRFLKKFAP